MMASQRFTYKQYSRTEELPANPPENAGPETQHRLNVITKSFHSYKKFQKNILHHLISVPKIEILSLCFFYIKKPPKDMNFHLLVYNTCKYQLSKNKHYRIARIQREPLGTPQRSGQLERHRSPITEPHGFRPIGEKHTSHTHIVTATKLVCSKRTTYLFYRPPGTCTFSLRKMGGCKSSPERVLSHFTVFPTNKIFE